MATLNFDSLVERKNDPGINVFILCLGDEHAYLSDESHWSQNSSFNVSLVRLTEDEFNVLDMGKHPKVWVLKDGEEKIQMNGIPAFEEFARRIREIK